MTTKTLNEKKIEHPKSKRPGRENNKRNEEKLWGKKKMTAKKLSSKP